MKLTHLSTFFIASTLLLFSCQAPDSDKAKTSEAKDVTTNSGDTYKVNTAASTVRWVGTKVSGYHSGSVNIKSGELTVQDGNITGGNFIMDMPSIAATGPKEVNEASNNKLTGHLRSADFFDVENYPEATFTITDIKPFSGTVNEDNDARQESLNEYKVTNPTHTVSGNLNIKGVTKNIEFPARITISDHTVDAVSKFNIDRRQWNLIYPGQPDDLIRDEIHLGIMLKASK